MKTILKKTIFAVLNAAIRRVGGTAPPSTAKTDISMNTKTMRSTTLPEKSTDDAPTATVSESNDGAPTAAGKIEEKAVASNRRTIVAIMLRSQTLVAAIALDTNVSAIDGSTINVVGSMDPRCMPSTHLRGFATPADAEKNFYEALAVSRERGWTIAHTGERNHG